MNMKQFHELNWEELTFIKFDKRSGVADKVHKIIMEKKLTITQEVLIPIQTKIDPTKDATPENLNAVEVKSLIVDFVNGQPVRQVDAYGVETVLEYDADYNNVLNMQRSDGHYEIFTYDEDGNILTWENSEGSSEKNFLNEKKQLIRHESTKEGGYWIEHVYKEDGALDYSYDSKDMKAPFDFDVRFKVMNECGGGPL